ncbi:hypothetical protein T4D_1985 [Trichinella pseudospiralis]|uniref:Uncharacterized protein n=1 Tax=Trichinella pseudospiralis TaxID=6337 RepID=A0A0V1DL59_TRIPS|nr:hypothetical protein T4D_1985 [Trichinella pseudospiralis]
MFLEFWIVVMQFRRVSRPVWFCHHFIASDLLSAVEGECINEKMKRMEDETSEKYTQH